jgi:hypothetical protein
MSEYEPELGQLAFGQPHQQFAVPAIMEAVLEHIEAECARVYWNVNQKQMPSPFGNSGPDGNLKTDVFEVQAYSWSDDEQPFNFAWRDLRISWYKYLGRGMSANMEITPNMASECLEECLSSVQSMDTSERGF